MLSVTWLDAKMEVFAAIIVSSPIQTPPFGQHMNLSWSDISIGLTHGTVARVLQMLKIPCFGHSRRTMAATPGALSRSASVSRPVPEHDSQGRIPPACPRAGDAGGRT